MQIRACIYCVYAIIEAGVLDWNDLRTLGEVARQGSLSEAARALGLHPTTVGRRVAAAEQALGRKLVLRQGRRGSSLTPTARELVAALLPLLDTVDRVAARASVGDAPVRLAATPNGARILAARLPLEALREQGVTIELAASNRAVDLARGEADLAIRLVDVDEPSLVRRRLGAVRYGLFASERYLVAHPVRRLDDGLAGHRVLSPSRELASGPEARWLAEHASSARVALRASDLLVLAEAAARGEGLVVLPANLAALHPLNCARRLDIPPRAVWLVYHQDLRRDPRIRLAADAVAEAVVASLGDEERVLEG